MPRRVTRRALAWLGVASKSPSHLLCRCYDSFIAHFPFHCTRYISFVLQHIFSLSDIAMPIQPLSECDIHALGSSLVLIDARSVIKELIDNALDAHANTISIEISVNTVDVIQVKDNGSGIGGDDRNLLCKRACTSKIRTIQDLESLGGSSLGFRGEALASIAALSSFVVITTRIDGEQVGSASKFGPEGHLLRQDFGTSHESPQTHFSAVSHQPHTLSELLLESKTSFEPFQSGGKRH